ncbi:MAG: lipase chaperone [Ramlibacter sp.]|nr:lipase chaperone [Ramlibacter sp.]
MAGLGGWWLGPGAGQPPAPAGSSSPTRAPAQFSPAQNATAGSSAPGNATPVPLADDPFLTPDLRYRLEAALLEAGEADTPASLKHKLSTVLARHFRPDELARATALIERYVDYRVALGAIKPPRDPGDPQALRTALNARDRLRSQYFGEHEHLALFGEEEALDRFTLARLEIERNPDLTASQKQAALQDTLAELTPQQRADRAASVQQLAVAAQTTALDAQSASEMERYQARQTLYGDAAALNLARLDRENADWQARLTQYANAQSGQTEAQLASLRQRLFSEQEQLRLEGALTLRRQSMGSTPIR